ncbi:YhhN-like protein [Shimia sp. SK013]|uniref:lysoplasmalogenase n=1 Tax=Shimia sp. SK013 TaxID=1389006 RepID=UPI0006CD7927|nr:lysoplasmalogenase [Shimia sp. SK013]KPA21747.1 YhhN-like protein [Shimia sp. SK013]
MTPFEIIALRQTLKFVFIGVGLLAALIYAVFFCHRPPSRAKTIVKAIPMPAFAAAAWISFGHPAVVIALLLSAVGDIALARDGERPFLIGLIAFAAAHVGYVVHFWTLGTGPLDAPWAFIAAIAVFALSTERWLIPFTGDMRWPVRIYVILISLMGLTALGLPGLPLATFGAFAFLASDTILSLQLFRMSDSSRWQRPASVALWLLYAGGQFLILAGSGWATPLF